MTAVQSQVTSDVEACHAAPELNDEQIAVVATVCKQARWTPEEFMSAQDAPPFTLHVIRP